MSEDIKKAYMNAFSMCENYPDPECTELRKLLSQKENIDFSYPAEIRPDTNDFAIHLAI